MQGLFVVWFLVTGGKFKLHNLKTPHKTLIGKCGFQSASYGDFRGIYLDVCLSVKT